jgi:AcrR family transcriptional regulator
MAGEAHEVRMKILNLILTYEVSKGHLKWKVSDVARKLKLSRSLIYYHFGKSKAEILDSCYQLIAEEFYGLREDLPALRSADQPAIEAAFLKTQAIYLDNPAIVIFFHRWRLERSEPQARILKMEERFRAKLKNAYPRLSPDELLAFQTIIHGAVTSPFCPPAAMKVLVELVQKRFVEKGRA